MGEDLKNSPRRKAALQDRQPPQSLEAEQAVLGCLFLSPRDTLPIAIDHLRRGAEDFYDLRHQEIFRTMLELYEDNDPIDVVTVGERLSTWKKLDGVGGWAYITGLPDSAPPVPTIEGYLAIVREKSLLRRMIEACTNVVSGIYDFEGDVDAKLDECERQILQIGQARNTGRALTIREYTDRAMAEIETAFQRGGTGLDGVSTGFADLDRLTGGMHSSEMIIIAARPSMGKTSLAMNIAENVAIGQRIPVGVFSLEMSATQLTKRMICSQARVNIRNVREGVFAERDFPNLTNAAGRVAGAPIFIDDEGGISVMQLRAKARRMWQQHNIRLFVVDYLQLLNCLGSKRRHESRQQEISEISGMLKVMAKEFDVPVIVLSQLNRELEKEKRKPRLSDLRESGAIEQDADVVGFLYRPHATQEEAEGQAPPEEQAAETINLLIDKQRNGPRGDIELTFLKPYTRFENSARFDDYAPRQTELNPRHADP